MDESGASVHLHGERRRSKAAGEDREQKAKKDE
jgi:hypothetical protein